MEMRIPENCDKYACINFLKRMYIDPLKRMYDDIPPFKMDAGTKELYFEGMGLMQYTVEGLGNYFELIRLNQQGIHFKENVDDGFYRSCKNREIIKDGKERESLNEDWLRQRKDEGQCFTF